MSYCRFRIIVSKTCHREMIDAIIAAGESVKDKNSLPTIIVES